MFIWIGGVVSPGVKYCRASSSSMGWFWMGIAANPWVMSSSPSGAGELSLVWRIVGISDGVSSSDSGSGSFVTTLQGRSVGQESGGACAILGMTLSRADLVFDLSVRSVRQRKVTSWLLNNSPKGLILR